MTEIYIGTHFEVSRKVITIGAIEKEIDKAVKEYKGKKVLLTMSKKIYDLCKINQGYDEEGFGVFKIDLDKRLPEREFILTELEKEFAKSSINEKRKGQ